MMPRSCKRARTYTVSGDTSRRWFANAEATHAFTTLRNANQCTISEGNRWCQELRSEWTDISRTKDTVRRIPRYLTAGSTCVILDFKPNAELLMSLINSAVT